MLSIYDLECNGLRDPRGICGDVLLSWRLGSDRRGAAMATFRLVTVTLSTGDVLWDTGMVDSSETSCRYEGRPLQPGEVCSWFVCVTDDAGEEAQSLPAVFIGGSPGDAPTSDLGPQRLGFLWTSDDALNDVLDCESSNIESYAWRELMGVARDGSHIRVAPTLPNDLSFAQGSLLIDQGLLLVRWEREAGHAALCVTLPPGTTGELVLGGNHRSVGSGRHVLECELPPGEYPPVAR